MVNKPIPNSSRFERKSLKGIKQVLITFSSEDEVKAFDKALAEERQLLERPNINRSSVARTLIRKWIKGDVKA